MLGAAIAAKDPVLGGAIMFSLAHGQGAILVAIGIGAAFLLPKLGKWMDSVKHLFGALLIAVAIYLLGYLPQVPVLFLWAALLIISAVFLGATQSLPEGASGWRTLWKGIGTFFLIWGVLALLGGFSGNRDILNPLPLSSLSAGVTPGIGGAGSAAEEHLFERVSTLSTLENRLASAKAAGKPVILDYYADWCTDCVRMEKSTFADPRVRQELRNRFVLLQADVTDPKNADGKAIKSRFGVYGPPAMLFFAADGEEAGAGLVAREDRPRCVGRQIVVLTVFAAAKSSLPCCVKFKQQALLPFLSFDVGDTQKFAVAGYRGVGIGGRLLAGTSAAAVGNHPRHRPDLRWRRDD